MTYSDQSEVVPYLTSAATIVYIQKWLKTTGVYQRFVDAFPGANQWAHWLIAGLMSLVVAAGIHWVWTGSLIKGGVLMIQIPDLASVAHGISDWLKVYVLQATVYDTQHQPPFSPPPTHPPAEVPTKGGGGVSP